MLRPLPEISSLSKFLPSWSIHLHFFSNPLPYFFTAFVLVNTISCVSPRNKIGHPDREHKRSKQVYVVRCLRNINRYLNICHCARVSRSGLAVRRWAGKRKDLGSIPLRLSFLFKKVVVFGHCLVTLSITS